MHAWIAVCRNRSIAAGVKMHHRKDSHYQSDMLQHTRVAISNPQSNMMQHTGHAGQSQAQVLAQQRCCASG